MLKMKHFVVMTHFSTIASIRYNNLYNHTKYYIRIIGEESLILIYRYL